MSRHKWNDQCIYFNSYSQNQKGQRDAKRKKTTANRLIEVWWRKKDDDKNKEWPQEILFLLHYKEFINFRSLMEGKNPDNRIFYQEKVHHRQQLRNQIDPKTIDSLEINQNPSVVSKKAYKSVYQDELERELQERNLNKQWEKTVQNSLYVPLNRMQKSSTFSQQSNSNLPHLHKNFYDYEKEKTIKVQAHINNNYDGGMGFFRASEQWDKKQKQRAKEMRETLHKQIENRNWKEFAMKNAKNLENQTFKEKQELDRAFSLQKNYADKQTKENNRNFILKQMEENNFRKQRPSEFQRNIQIRHNPITNPIEYHIENPYILKKIQDQATLKRC